MFYIKMCVALLCAGKC